ncbi:MAG: hypothetical protein FJ143_04790, partial [Deltaproteobacteria bacterium]|nr:hypothetical protein [Deltaproteobacteria bacterium]
MPAAVPAIAGFFVGEMVAGMTLGYLGAKAMMTANIVGAIAGGLVATGLSRAMAEKPIAATFDAVARGALINTAGTVDPIPVIYGTRRAGGSRIFTEVSDGTTTNEFLNLVFVLGEGEVSAVNTVYLDEVASTDARFSGLVTLEKYVGTDDQSASPGLISVLPAKWTSAHRGRGFAYLYLRLKFSESAFPNGLPQVTADVNGKLVYDPRDAATKFSNNPALCIRDYLTNSRYGWGLATGVLDESSFSAAANHCDELVSSPAGNQKRYTCDGLTVPDNGRSENLKALLSSCRGAVVFSGGKYKLLIDKAESALSFTFNEDNILGAWQIQNASKREKFNRVKAKFFNPDRRWQPDFAIHDSSTHRTEDNGLLLESELDLPFTSNLYRAQQIAMLEEKASRFGIAARFRGSIAGMQCEVGDVVPITHTTPAWSAKPFRITAMTLLPNDEVEIAAREYQAGAYDLDALSTARTVPATGLPDPFTVAAPSGLTLESGTAQLFIAGDGTVHSRIKASWTLSTNIFVTAGGRAEIQFKKTAGSPEQDWSPSLFFDGSLTQAFLDPVDDGDTYTVRIRFENQIGVRSGFSTGSHTVVGKTQAPEDVTGFTAQQNANVVVFRWNQIADLDLAGYEIRYGNASIAWADATPLTRVTRGTQITTAALSPGAWDTLIKARDTSGNYSTNATRYAITVTNAFDIVQESEQYPRWLGARVNLIKHWTGVLIPDSTKLASAHTKAELFEQFVPYPYATCQYEAPEVGLGFDASVRTWADIDSVLGPGLTVGVADPDLQLDYRRNAGSYDGYENWTIGTATGKYFKHRLNLDTSRGKPVIRGFKPVIDTEKRTETGTGITVGTTGTTVTFATPFHTTPNVEVINEGSTPLIPTRTAVSGSGFTAHLYNTSGTQVGGTAGYR